MNKLKFGIVILLLAFTTAVWASSHFPKLVDRVVDEPSLLSAVTKQNIIAKLKAFENKSGTQITVAVVNDLGGYEIRDYGVELARFWQLGQKDKNNGVLLLVAPNERKVAIEVGYGLEGSLTDGLSFLIVSEKITPLFKDGQMGAGIEAGVDAIIQALIGEITEQSLKQEKDQTSWQEILIFTLFFGIIIFIALRNSRSNNNSGNSYSGGGYSHSSGAGFSGGGFSGGGFSGGGGSFGGGGASGGW